MSSDSPIFEPGQLVDGKYKIVRVIGRGGMGVVYEAYHELLAQPVALKVVLPEISGHPEIVARFMTEARNSAKIESDHVARIMDVGKLKDGSPFMVMELLTGRDLDAVLAKEGLLDPARAVDILLETLDGVAAAHALGIIHRDLKPGNLFLSQKQGRPLRVKVLDFGISKALGPAQFAGAHITSTSSIVGSPAYMSPEQLRGSKRIDQRADIWSLGVIAYQLVTGVLPYEADNVGALFAAILETEPMRPIARSPGIPEALDRAIMKCLAKNADDRFSTVLQLALTLAPLGTKVAQRALERIEGLVLMTPTKQFQPTSSSPAIAAPAQPTPAPAPEAFARTHLSDPHLEARDEAPRGTQGSWATKDRAPANKSSPRLFVFAIAALAAIGALVFGAVRLRPTTPKEVARSATSVPTQIVASAIAPDAPAATIAPLESANAATATTESATDAGTATSPRKKTKPASSGKSTNSPDDLFGRF